MSFLIKRSIALFIASALLFAGWPGPAWAGIAAAVSKSAAVPGAGVQAGGIPRLGAVETPLSFSPANALSVNPSLSTSLVGLNQPRLSADGSAIASESLVNPAGGFVSVPSGLSAELPAKASTIAEEAAAESVAGSEPGTRGSLKTLEKTLSRARDSGRTASSLGILNRVFSGWKHQRGDSVFADQNARFDGIGRRGLKPGTMLHVHTPSAVDPAVDAVIFQTTSEEKASDGKKKKVSLPRSFYLYLTSQLLYGIGQESAALLTPLYAYFAMGLEFAVASQAAALLAIIPGSMLGAKWIRKFDAKKVYFWGNLIHGLFFLSIPVLHWLTGSFSPVHFIAFKIVSGMIYGALRGVAEKEITPRIVGQNKARLKKAGSMFYASFESAEMISALATGFMIAAMGLNLTSFLMAGIMLLSLIPLYFIKYKRKGPVKDPNEKGGTEKKLPKLIYLPFVFAMFAHMALYDFIAPFMALEVFAAEAFGAQMIGAYTFGSLAVALFTSYAPKAASSLSERGWAALGVLSFLAFLWGSLIFVSPYLSLALAWVMGVGLTGMMIQWRAIYQQRLALDAQPKAFERLMIASVLVAIIPFAIMQGGLFLPGVSMALLLKIVAVIITVVSLGFPLGLFLYRRFGKRSK